jgi:GTPase Era involved in 16S rRNA processing
VVIFFFKKPTHTMFGLSQALDDAMQAQPFRVLVVGERSVGKSSLVAAIRESLDASCASGSDLFPPMGHAKRLRMSQEYHCQQHQQHQQQHMFLNTPSGHSSTSSSSATNLQRTYVPCPSSVSQLRFQRTLLDDVLSDKVSTACKSFILNPSMRQSTIACRDNALFATCSPTDSYRDIVLEEYSPCARSRVLLPLHHPANPAAEVARIRSWANTYDCLLVVADYGDITSLRSVGYWCKLAGLSAQRIVVCVNKCDHEPRFAADDFQFRKAKIVHFLLQRFAVEYTSAVTGTNLHFLYKYMNQVDFRQTLSLSPFFSPPYDSVTTRKATYHAAIKQHRADLAAKQQKDHCALYSQKNVRLEFFRGGNGDTMVVVGEEDQNKVEEEKEEGAAGERRKEVSSWCSLSLCAVTI